MSSRRSGRSRATRSSPNKETSAPKASLKRGNAIKREHSSYIKMFMYGRTGCGTTYGALHILRSKHFKGDLIYINNDIPQNLRDNVELFTDEEQERLVIPVDDDDGDYQRVNTPPKWKAVWSALQEEYGDFSGVAGIVLDYIENLYDGYIRQWNPQTPFAYGEPNNAFYDDVIVPLMNAKTNVIIIGKESPVYVDVGQGDQFAKNLGQYRAFWDGKSIEKWKVDFGYIVYRDTMFRDDREQVKYRTIFEKHKLGIEPIIMPPQEDMNLFNVFYQYYLDKQKEIKGS